MSSLTLTVIEPGNAPPDSWDLGHMDLTLDGVTISSRNASPGTGFMIYPSMVDLLDGLKKLHMGAEEVYEFVGADSSFIILFSLQGQSVLVDSTSLGVRATVPLAELSETVLRGVEALLEERPLSTSAVIYDDLMQSIQQFKLATSNVFE